MENQSAFDQATDAAVEHSTQGIPQGEQQPAAQTAAELLDLEKHDKFVFKGKEYTPSELEKSIMRQADYTKKTQAVQANQKYWGNLYADLENVRKNPGLAQEFVKIYPREFHTYLSLIDSLGKRTQAQPNNQTNVPPELQNRLDRVEGYVKEKEIEAYSAKIDTIFSKLSQKYPNGNEDVVLARAQALLEQLRPGEEITDEIYDKLWKQSHDTISAKISGIQKQKLTNQRTLNNRGKGPGPGGGTPGQAPQRIKLKDVADHAIRGLTGK